MTRINNCRNHESGANCNIKDVPWKTGDLVLVQGKEGTVVHVYQNGYTSVAFKESPGGLLNVTLVYCNSKILLRLP